MVARTPVAEPATHRPDVPDSEGPEPEEPPPQTPVAGFGERSTGFPGRAQGVLWISFVTPGQRAWIDPPAALVAVVTSRGVGPSGCPPGVPNL